MSNGRITFEHIGIGALLTRGRLSVPPNQRSYKWEDEHVIELFQDLRKALDSNDYFLGTIVLTGTDGPISQVTDGQQRLATTTIMFAAIRDFFLKREDTNYVKQIESDFLSFIDYGSGETVPRLTLNIDDTQFFTQSIITQPQERPPLAGNSLSDSNKRLLRAFELANEHIQ